MSDPSFVRLTSCTMVGFIDAATEKSSTKYRSVFENGLEWFTDQPLVPGAMYRVTVEHGHE